MKLPFLTLFAALLSGVGAAHALPPAPFYTLDRTVRDDVRQIVEVPGAQVRPPHFPTTVRVLTVTGAAGATWVDIFLR